MVRLRRGRQISGRASERPVPRRRTRGGMTKGRTISPRYRRTYVKGKPKPFAKAMTRGRNPIRRPTMRRAQARTGKSLLGRYIGRYLGVRRQRRRSSAFVRMTSGPNAGRMAWSG